MKWQYCENCFKTKTSTLLFHTPIFITQSVQTFGSSSELIVSIPVMKSLEIGAKQITAICWRSRVRFWELYTWYAKRQYILLYFLCIMTLWPRAIGVVAPMVYRTVAGRKRSCARRYNIIIIESHSFAFRMLDMILLRRNKNILYNARYEYRTIRPGIYTGHILWSTRQPSP